MTFRPRTELAIAVERDFERVALPYFQLAFPGIARPTPREYWDRRGVDLMTTPENDPVEVCIQCKTTMKREFDVHDVDNLTKEIDKFLASDIRCKRYILALNRNDFGGRIREAVRERTAKIKNGPSFEVWEISAIVRAAQNGVIQLIRDRVAQFNQEWRDQLVGRFAPSGSWVRRVPARSYRMMLDWEKDPELRDRSDAADIDVNSELLDDKGPRLAVLIGNDGTGKTFAALIASQARDRTVIYVPVASLDGGNLGSTNGLTKEIGRALNVHPAGVEGNRLFLYFLGRGLTTILKQDSSVVLIIDGLDESGVFRGFQGLKLIRSHLKGLLCRAIITTRTKHFNLRSEDFSQALHDLGKIGRRNRGVRVLELLPWTEETIIKHIDDVGRALPVHRRTPLLALVEAIRAREAEAFYGTLLSHPIFLDLIIDDVINEQVRKSSRSSLVRSWIFRKIRRDQVKYDTSPVGGDLAQESRLIFRALEDVALAMSEPLTRTPLERISHGEVLRIFATYRLTDDEIFQVLLKSVLVAVGHTTTFRDANIMFSHRIFHEYMIASALIRRHEQPLGDTPSEIVSFYEELRGQSTPSIAIGSSHGQ